MEPYMKSKFMRVNDIECHGNIRNTKRDINIPYESSNYNLRTGRKGVS